MSFLREFWEFLKIRKKYWLLPIIIVLVLFTTSCTVNKLTQRQVEINYEFIPF